MDFEKYKFIEEYFTNLKNEYLNKNYSIIKNKAFSKIKCPPEDNFNHFPDYSSPLYHKYEKTGIDAIKNNEVALVIVNGGMATRFGNCVKGIVEVIDGKSFLQLKLENVKKINKIYKAELNVFLMNSFATSEATINHLRKKEYFGLKKETVLFFNQYISKRLNPDGSIFEDAEDKSLTYYAPGHGDFFYAFNESGCYNFAKSKNIKYLIFCNVDNLGAYIEPVILGYHILNGKEMTAELAKKNPGDKGGLPALVRNKLQIVEDFKIPKDFDRDSIKYFNTATYIFNISIFEKNINLPWYIVEKKVNEKKVIQFERLTGDLSFFLDAGYIVVPRDKRFIPIKTQEDLQNYVNKIKSQK